MRSVCRFFVLATALLMSGNAKAETTAEVFERPSDKILHLDYLLSLPEGYESDSEKQWPLLVFLHGSGERGSTLSKVAVHGPPKLVAEGKQFPFILVSPQCPADEWWSEQPVLELIDSLSERYRVDSNRVYLTGLSMGGYGTWHFASRAPERFAAIVPICGGGIPYMMRRLKELPIWVFHGGKDVVVPLEESSRLVLALNKVGNEITRFTIYPEAGHDSWTEAYANPELYEWLLSHSLSPKP